MEGLYFINDSDLFLTCGFVPGKDRKTSNSFLMPHDEKPVFTHDWGDQNGVEFDLTATARLLPRTFVLDGTIIANTEYDFWQRYNAFKALLSDTEPFGYITVFVGEFDTNFLAIKKSISNVSRITPIKGGQMVFSYITVELTENLQVL